MSDLKFALRQLLKNPGFTAVAVLTLALGIGVNTAIFTVLNALVFRPLPFCESDRVVRFVTESDFPGSGRVSYSAYVDFCGLTNLFGEIAAVSDIEESVALIAGDRRERVRARLVTANYFIVLGATPAVGRGFLPEENAARGGHPVVVLSHRLWERSFEADPKVIGKSIKLNNHFFTVIGVAPKGFRGDSLSGDPDVWAPLMMFDQIQLSLARAERDVLTDRGQDWLRILGVLKQDATQEQAAAAVKVLNRQIQSAEVAAIMKANRLAPHGNPGDAVSLAGFPNMTVQPLPEANRNRFFLRIGGFIQALGIGLLLVACANIANLLLVRGLARRSEIAIRLALGSKRARLLRQLLTESLLLAALAGGLGTLFSWWLVKLFGHWTEALSRSHGLQLAAAFSPDIQVLAFALVLSGITGVVFGLVPAWRASGADLANVLKDAQASPVVSDRRFNLHDLLTAGQVSVTLILVIVGAIFIKSSMHLLRVDLGFDTEGLLAVPFDFEADGIPAAEQRALTERMLDRLRGLPGVEAGSFTQHLPCIGVENELGTFIGAPDGSERMYGASDSIVESDFFRTAGIPLVEGRGFQPVDEKGLPVVVISEALAAELWPSQSAVGKPLLVDRRVGSILKKNILAKGTWVTVVGVAKEVGFHLGRQHSRKNQLYRPAIQSMPSQMHLLVRVKDDSKTYIASLRSAIRSVDSRCELAEPRPFRDFLGPMPVLYRDVTVAMLVMGLAGLFLAAIGLYATVSYSGSRRFKEFGIRLALGATRSDLAGLVVYRGLLVAGVGTACGLIGAHWTTKVTGKFLFDVQPMETAVVITATLLIGLILLMTSLIPALRAAKVDPMEALRYE